MSVYSISYVESCTENTNQSSWINYHNHHCNICRESTQFPIAPRTQEPLNLRLFKRFTPKLSWLQERNACRKHYSDRNPFLFFFSLFDISTIVFLGCKDHRFSMPSTLLITRSMFSLLVLCCSLPPLLPTPNYLPMNAYTHTHLSSTSFRLCLMEGNHRKTAPHQHPSPASFKTVQEITGQVWQLAAKYSFSVVDKVKITAFVLSHPSSNQDTVIRKWSIGTGEVRECEADQQQRMMKMDRQTDSQWVKERQREKGRIFLSPENLCRERKPPSPIKNLWSVSLSAHA